MFKKIIWLIVILALIAFGVYYKKYYPDSQLQYKLALRHAIAIPVEHFYNADEPSCGIWYQSANSQDNFRRAKDNEQVKACFQQAFKRCQNKNILLVNDLSQVEEKTITYSLLRILLRNDQDECLLQNYYEQYNVLALDEIPLNFINSCTVLDEDFIGSCEPLYIKEMREEKKLEAEIGSVEIELAE